MMTSTSIKGIGVRIQEMVYMSQITTAEFAAALETDTRTVRKFLRAITPKEDQPGKGSRWVLEGNKRSLAQMKKRFDEWTAEREAAKEETVEELDEKLAETEIDAEGEIS